MNIAIKFVKVLAIKMQQTIKFEYQVIWNA